MISHCVPLPYEKLFVGLAMHVQIEALQSSSVVSEEILEEISDIKSKKKFMFSRLGNVVYRERKRIRAELPQLEAELKELTKTVNRISSVPQDNALVTRVFAAMNTNGLSRQTAMTLLAGASNELLTDPDKMFEMIVSKVDVFSLPQSTRDLLLDLLLGPDKPMRGGKRFMSDEEEACCRQMLRRYQHDMNTNEVGRRIAREDGLNFIGRGIREKSVHTKISALKKELGVEMKDGTAGHQTFNDDQYDAVERYNDENQEMSISDLATLVYSQTRGEGSILAEFSWLHLYGKIRTIRGVQSKCNVKGCNVDARSDGMCTVHYNEQHDLKSREHIPDENKAVVDMVLEDGAINSSDNRQIAALGNAILEQEGIRGKPLTAAMVGECKRNSYSHGRMEKPSDEEIKKNVSRALSYAASELHAAKKRRTDGED